MSIEIMKDDWEGHVFYSFAIQYYGHDFLMPCEDDLRQLPRPFIGYNIHPDSEFGVPGYDDPNLVVSLPAIWPEEHRSRLEAIAWKTRHWRVDWEVYPGNHLSKRDVLSIWSKHFADYPPQPIEVESLMDYLRTREVLHVTAETKDGKRVFDNLSSITEKQAIYDIMCAWNGNISSYSPGIAAFTTVAGVAQALGVREYDLGTVMAYKTLFGGTFKPIFGIVLIDEDHPMIDAPESPIQAFDRSLWNRIHRPKNWKTMPLTHRTDLAGKLWLNDDGDRLCVHESVKWSEDKGFHCA